MIDALFKSGRKKKEAMDLFAAISANGFVPNVFDIHCSYGESHK
jgi:pentatricopeptide repeat protein